MASEEERRCSEEAGVERTADAPKVEPPPVYFAPMTSSKPRYFYDPQAFPQLAALREHLDEIAEEALTLHRASVAVAAEVVGNFDSWSGDASFNSIAQQVSQAGGWVKWWNNDSPTDPNKTLGFDWTIFGFMYVKSHLQTVSSPSTSNFTFWGWVDMNLGDILKRMASCARKPWRC